jgi:hypothetical protein
MKHRAIPDTDRDPFFARFTHEHAGALVTLRVNAHEEVIDRPLFRLGADGSDVIVHAGSARPGHRIPHVSSLQLELTDGGADSALCMTSEDGTRAEVRLRTPVTRDSFDPAVE